MKAIVIIPARLNAVRLPRKPLALIHQKPMIVHVWEGAHAAAVGPVLVACCGTEIESVVTKAGGRAVITDPSLPSGTDRVWAAFCQAFPDADDSIIINLQGDIPGVTAEMLTAVLEPLENPDVDIATIAAPMTDVDMINNPNIVKIAYSPISETMGKGLYFSRSPIPHGAECYYNHIGIYAYRRSALERFVSLPPSTLEKAERLEQLRALEDGMRIDVRLVPEAPISVDTQKDLDAVSDYFERIGKTA
ncbi:MAG: 3-deoxy-manno-octulosonate cytidylyltransferase [Alphaproteobacteria bacterium]|nr:3-deoxy-manno-octulosonate cytidylyltransferase [Alphaproteobacteria bacterium]